MSAIHCPRVPARLIDGANFDEFLDTQNGRDATLAKEAQ